MASLVGKTPMVEIRYRFRGEEKSVFAKLEYYNPSGSIKDRIAEYIIAEAERSGDLKPGQAIVEVTSGNTGISFSAMGARKGYPVHIFMPDWVSGERKLLMRMFGATVHEVSREEGGFMEAFRRADALSAEIGAFMPKQFENMNNVYAHYYGTGAEILKQLPDVTDFVSGIGTGGTLMGVTKALREKNEVRITAMEPDSLPLLRNSEATGEHKIEGIGDDFIPAIVDLEQIDNVVDVNDDDAIMMSSRLATELGLGVGISSGANFIASVLVNTDEGRRVVTVFPDDNKKYISTDLSRKIEKKTGMVNPEIELLDVIRL